jgi:DNA invertase Pin-like site-specific DNA recombinase
MKVVIACRRSSDDPNNTGSLTEQERACRERLETEEGWQLLAVTKDDGVSGRRVRPADRLELGPALKLNPDLVLVQDADRFTRSERHWHEFLEQYPTVNVLSLDGRLNTFERGPAARWSRRIATGQAEEEAIDITRRTLRGRVKTLEAGLRVGARDPFGYRTERQFVQRGSRQVVDRVFKVNEDEAAIIERAAALILDEHLPTTEVARLLNAEGLLRRGGKQWSSQELRRVLRNPILAGTFTWRQRRSWKEYDHEAEDQVFEMEAPAILAQQRFDALQLKLERKSQPKRGRQYPLSGRVFMPCGRHATGYSQHAKGRLYPYMKCTGIPNSTSAPGTESCGCRMARADHLEALAWQFVLDRLQNPDPVLALTGGYGKASSADALRKELQAAEADERRLTEGIRNIMRTTASGGLDADDIEAATRELTEQREAVRRRIETVRELVGNSRKREAQKQRMYDLTQMAFKLTAATPGLQKQMFDLFDVKVYVGGDEPRFEGDFDQLAVSDDHKEVLTTSSNTVALRIIRPAPRVAQARSGSSATSS